MKASSFMNERQRAVSGCPRTVAQSVTHCNLSLSPSLALFFKLFLTLFFCDFFALRQFVIMYGHSVYACDWKIILTIVRRCWKLENFAKIRNFTLAFWFNRADANYIFSCTFLQGDFIPFGWNFGVCFVILYKNARTAWALRIFLPPTIYRHPREAASIVSRGFMENWFSSLCIFSHRGQPRGRFIVRLFKKLASCFVIRQRPLMILRRIIYLFASFVKRLKGTFR